MPKKTLYIALASILALAFFPRPSESQWPVMREDADSLLRAGLKYVYGVKFDSARACFERVIQKYPNFPAGYFLDAMVEWQKIRIFRGETKYDEAFLRKIDKVIEVCERRLDSNQFDIAALFFLGGAYGYRGRFYAKRGNYFKVAFDGKKGFDILKKCWRLAPTNRDIMLGTGIYNYFSVAFAEKYPILKPVVKLFPKGDKSLGIKQLISASKYSRYSKIEAKDALLQIYYEFEKNYDKAYQIAKELFETFPTNPYYHRYYGRCLVIKGYPFGQEALKQWKEILRRCVVRATGYDELTAREALYYIGYEYYRFREYEKARKYFERCDALSRRIDKDEPSGFLIKTNLYLGKIYDALGNRSLAAKKYRQLLKWRDYDRSRYYAKKYLQKPFGAR